MLVQKTGDILQATENIICHQVNEDGIMGGGLAKQIANQYPKVEDLYKRFCNYNKYNIEKLLGENVLVKLNNHQFIANCFTQNKFVTDLLAIDTCFSRILLNAKRNGYNIAIPYKYGCGIAKGNWSKVKIIFERLSSEFDVDISIYKLREENYE